MCQTVNSAVMDATLVANNNSELKVSISKTEKQIGQYFRVTLRYRGEKKLSQIKLQKWKQDFKIIEGDEYESEDELRQIIQVLKLRLYPRVEGVLTLPVLRLGQEKSQAMHVNVIASQVNKSHVKLNWTLSNDSPWQREPVFLRLQLQTKDIAAHVLLALSETKNGLFKPLKIQRRVLDDGSIVFDVGWVFYLKQEGSLLIDFPVIRYQLSGSDRRRFYLPLQTLNVKALPSYLPPNLPIAKLTLHSEVITNDNPVSAKNNHSWKILVQTPALMSQGVPGLAKQLAMINAYDIAKIKIEKIRSEDKNQHTDQFTYYAPLPQWLMPFGKKLEVKLRYFNPTTGQVDTMLHTLPRVWNMPQWAWTIVFFISLILFITIILKLKPPFDGQLRLIKFRKQIKAAETPQQLRNIILDYVQVITLSQWVNQNSGNFNRKLSLSNKLNKICFSNIHEGNLAQLKQKLLQI